MAIEWSPDYCLSCDRQCPAGAAYCSPSCKLADAFEWESNSNSSSPLSIASSAPPAPSNGFYLPPALNFSAMGHYSSSSPNSKSPVSSKTPPPTNLVSNSNSRQRQPHQQQQPQPSGGLHQSNSRTSLSSLPAQYGSHESSYLSNKAAEELRAYENSFDQVRGWKRRMTVSGC